MFGHGLQSPMGSRPTAYYHKHGCQTSMKDRYLEHNHTNKQLPSHLHGGYAGGVYSSRYDWPKYEDRIDNEKLKVVLLAHSPCSLLSFCLRKMHKICLKTGLCPALFTS